MKSNAKVKKVEFLSIRLTPQKYAELQHVSAMLGLSAAGFARSAIFEKLSKANPFNQQQAA